MEFKYYTFDVKPWLQLQKQPVFTAKDVTAPFKYYTLTDLETMEYGVTTSGSAGVRVPVFAVSTSMPQEQAEKVQGLDHGSMLFAMGMENALQFLDSLRLPRPVDRAIIVLSKTCHALSDNRYRAYFGITLEVA